MNNPFLLMSQLILSFFGENPTNDEKGIAVILGLILTFTIAILICSIVTGIFIAVSDRYKRRNFR